jgi:hypothetical protein
MAVPCPQPCTAAEPQHEQTKNMTMCANMHMKHAHIEE